MTYETKLLNDLKTLKPQVWYKCPEKDYDKFVETVKGFIDAGEDFEFNSNYKKIRRLVWLGK
jgi:hypothetical protein